jgi:hypothetical protein
MDCEYLLVCTSSGKVDKQFQFHASTPEEAEVRGTEITRAEQKLNVEEFPFAPVPVKSMLYRCFREFDGADFIIPRLKRSEAQPHKFA